MVDILIALIFIVVPLGSLLIISTLIYKLCKL
jgi:hypothetical protein